MLLATRKQSSLFKGILWILCFHRVLINLVVPHTVSVLFEIVLRKKHLFVALGVFTLQMVQ